MPNNFLFNEAALEALVNNEDGPLGRKMRLVAEQITTNYQAAIGGVWQNQPASVQPQADYALSVGPFGLQAEIGIVRSEALRFDGKPNASEYMANKFQNLEPDKFEPKIMAGWDDPL